MKKDRRSPAWWMSIAASAGVLLVIAACGPGGRTMYPVEGKVVFPDGTPLTGGMVEFESVGGEGNPVNARGRIGSDGTFCLSTYKEGDGVMQGEHRAIVRPLPPPIAPINGPPPKKIIDPRFERYDTSGLSFTVTKGKNNFTIQVTRPGG